MVNAIDVDLLHKGVYDWKWKRVLLGSAIGNETDLSKHSLLNKVRPVWPIRELFFIEEQNRQNPYMDVISFNLEGDYNV